MVTHAARAYVPTPELGTAYEDVSFTTSDGLRLEGWYVPTKNGATVVVIPGRKGPQKPARLLAEHGYGVLLFDRRGEGESEGDPNGFGWAGTRDVRGGDRLPAQAGPRSTRAGSAGSASRSAARSSSRRRPRRTTCRRSSPRARASAPCARRSSCPGSDSWITTGVIGLITAATAAFTSDLPPPGLKDLSADISVPVLLHLRHPRPGRREPQPDLLRGREPAQGALGGRRRPHGRHRRRAARVRAAGRRLLRRSPARRRLKPVEVNK